MRKWDVFIVRLLPLVMCLFITYVVINAWCNIYIENMEYIFGNSFIYATSFFIVSLSNRKFHCIWNRALYTELMFVPLLNFIDAKWDIIPDNYTFLMILTLSLVLTLIITLILAIRHFLKPRIKKMRYGTGQD